MLALLAACSAPAARTQGTDERCPSWEASDVAASGTLTVSGEGITNDRWQMAIEPNDQAPGQHLVTVSACSIELHDEYPWEPWVFNATWRLDGPIATPTMIPGATLVGTPGMSGGVSARELECVGADCDPQVTEAWLFMQNGAAELAVDVWDPAARHFKSQGWVLTDGGTPTQVDLAVDLRW